MGFRGPLSRPRPPRPQARLRLTSPAALARSYMDPFVDKTGRLSGFGLAELRELGAYDWRFAERSAWKIERWLIDYPHHKVHMPDRRYHEWHERYLRYISRYRGRKPVYYENRDTWVDSGSVRLPSG